MTISLATVAALALPILSFVCILNTVHDPFLPRGTNFSVAVIEHCEQGSLEQKEVLLASDKESIMVGSYGNKELAWLEQESESSRPQPGGQSREYTGRLQAFKA